jgi:hypothetical protein
MKKDLTIIPSEAIVKKIFVIRNRKVMIDRDLADLYGVTTGNLNLAVKRNIKRFPEDFMFQLTKEEMKNWILQIEISNSKKMGLRKLPLAFTEQGVAMLSGVLNSDRAINVNIQIIRTFTKIRDLLATNEALQRKMIEIERKYDGKIKEIFDTLGFLLEDKIKTKKKIGF